MHYLINDSALMRYNTLSNTKGMNMQVESFGYKWTQQKNGYFQSTRNIDGKRRWLHQWTWEQHNGTKQPTGYQVHHKDEDKSNNCYTNLKLMSASDHRKHHGFQGDMDKQRAHLDRIRPLTKAYHASTEGIAQHKDHYEKMKHKLYVKAMFTCAQCGSEYEGIVNGKNKFCSNVCMSKHRRLSGVDDIQRPCEVCGTEFTVNKYQNRRTCGKTCMYTLRKKD